RRMAAQLPGTPQSRVDGAYYAGLAHLFLNGDGSLKFTAVSNREVKTKTTEKRDFLKQLFRQEVEYLPEVMAVTGAKSEYLERYRNYTALLRKKLERYEKALK
ncbi:MAG: hypothetical protein Q8P02_02040, partial [Candidatus Micrarchaeota archaeon]|nr:hypothetical protein [Candidatus Micrarchaeota archaeon]